MRSIPASQKGPSVHSINVNGTTEAEDSEAPLKDLATTSPILAAKLARLPAEQVAMILGEWPAEGGISAARAGMPGS
ncbi:hypothetical protein ACIQC5_12455 [Paenarthrobacter sp. NPDC092416]|uniref:hypothetical protein n=1 Tax=Paenarthrobacter sp. NPDC092416 TaxID=3364386 RepID=UPI0038259BF3